MHGNWQKAFFMHCGIFLPGLQVFAPQQSEVLCKRSPLCQPPHRCNVRLLHASPLPKWKEWSVTVALLELSNRKILLARNLGLSKHCGDHAVFVFNRPWTPNIGTNAPYTLRPRALATMAYFSVQSIFLYKQWQRLYSFFLHAQRFAVAECMCCLALVLGFPVTGSVNQLFVAT